MCLIVGATIAQEKPELTFSPIGGVYEKETVVTLEATPGSTIYYTLDGTSPGSHSRRYKSPFTISEVAVIRAIAYNSGKRSDVGTNTYVCDRPYNLPVVSLATDTANLWNYSRGIYVKGCCADTIEPYMGANYWRDWEKYANIEMYDEEGKLCFNQPCGINIFGGFSRMLPMKSLAVFARKKYGDNKFRYQIFPEREEDKYKSFILRNSGGDFLRTHIRDAYMTQLAKPTGVAIQAYRPAVVFINGKYWGIQNLREKISEHYLASNYGVDKENVDILRQNGVKRHGYSTNYKKLLAYLRNNDLAKDAKVDELRGFMDVDDFIRYNIAEVYSDNRDAGGNIRYWRERNDSAKWRWVFYDLDLGLGNNNPSGYKRNTLRKFTSVNNEGWPDPPWSTFIIRSLLANQKLQTQYINTFADHLNTVYHPDTANRLMDKMVAGIDDEMKFHQKRWGSSYKNWKHHVAIMRKFVTLRPHFCRLHIMQKFGLKDTLNISVNHPGEEICNIQFNSLDLDRSYEGIYFKNVEVEIKVEPRHDYEFVGWQDGSKEGNNRKVTPTKDLVLEPVLRPKKMSGFNEKIFFYELAFYQTEEDSSGDWVELYNRTENNIDLSNWVFTDRGHNKGWRVPQGVSLPANSFLVFAQNLDNFRTKFPADSVIAIGDFDFGLSRKGELIKLYDGEGFIVDSVNYAPLVRDLPDTAFTLSLVHPDSSARNLSWVRESPTPSSHSQGYLNYLQNERDKKYWTKVFYIGGGSFFFILVVGLISFRYYRKKKRLKTNA